MLSWAAADSAGVPGVQTASAATPITTRVSRLPAATFSPSPRRSALVAKPASARVIIDHGLRLLEVENRPPQVRG